MVSPPSSASDVPSIFKLPETLSPNSIDTIPVLSSLLSRLQNSSLSNPTSTTGIARSATSPSQLMTGSGPITDKDIPPATDGLKYQLQKARAQIRQLPDMDRSIEEQEAEIKDLEDMISRQRGVICELRALGRTSKKENEQMEVDGITQPV